MPIAIYCYATIFAFRNLVKKGYPPILDTCGFLGHMERISKTHIQIEQSAYVFFCLLKTFLKVFLPEMQLTALSCRDLVQRETKEHRSLPFMTRRGVRTMKPSSFQTMAKTRKKQQMVLTIFVQS